MMPQPIDFLSEDRAGGPSDKIQPSFMTMVRFAYSAANHIEWVMIITVCLFHLNALHSHDVSLVAIIKAGCWLIEG